MRLKFRDKLILLVLIILIIAGTSYFFVSVQLAKNIENNIVERLTKSNETYEEFNKVYFDQLLTQTIAVSDNPKFSAQLSTGDKATVLEGLNAFNENLKADIFSALSPGGEVLASVGSSS